MHVLLPLFVLGSIGTIAILSCVGTLGPAHPNRAWLRRTLLLAFALRLGAATMFAFVEETRVFHEDAEGTENRGVYLATLWREGESTEYLTWPGTKNRGYYYVCGAECFVFGLDKCVPSFVNAILAVLTLFMVHQIACRHFHPVIARRATWLLAITPSMILWSATAIKDTLVTFLIVVALGSCMRLRERLSLGAVLGTFLLPLAVYPVRFYIVYFLIAAIFGSLMITKRLTSVGSTARNLLIGGAVVATLALVGVNGQAADDSSYFTLSRASSYRMGMASTAVSGFAQDVDISTPSKAIVFFPYGLSVLLFGPFPWQFTSFRSLLTLPEMIFWWSRFPALVRGTRMLIRRRLVEMAPLLVFSFLLSAAYSLIHGNVGSGYRQRAQIFVFLFIFTAVGEYMKTCRMRGIDEGLLLRGQSPPS